MLTNCLKYFASMVLVMLAGSAFAANAPDHDVDTSEWICEYCPFESGVAGEYEAGVTSVSDDSAYIGDATGLDEDGVYPVLGGNGTAARDNGYVEWTLRDLGLDTRSLSINGTRYDSFSWRLAYDEVPRRRFITTSSIYSQSGGVLSLPGGWVSAPDTGGFTALGSSLFPVDIGSDRTSLAFAAGFRLPASFRLTTNLRRQERDGNVLSSGSYFTQSTHLARPVDTVTHEMDIALRYDGDKGFASLAWYLSDFENRFDSLRWESPFTTAPGAEVAALAESPDNRFQQLTASAGMRLDRYATVITGSASVGRLTQDEPFLPYTTNTTLVVPALPRSRLDGEVDTLDVALALTSRITPRGRVRLSWRYGERDNQTPVDAWTRVITDTFLSGETRSNTPYSFERTALKLTGDYRLFDDLRVSAGYEYRTMDRRLQEVTDQSEDTGWGRVRWHPLDWLDIDVRGGASDREIDGYDESLAADLDQNPRLRKYNLASRFRQFGEATVSLSPVGSPMTLALTGAYAEDDYDETLLGLTSGRERRIAGDLGFAIGERGSAYLTTGYERIDVAQTGSQSFLTPDWQALTEDEFSTVGAGIRLRDLGDKVDLGLDYLRSDGTTDIAIAPLGSSGSAFPEIDNVFDTIRLDLVYRRSDRLHIRTTLRYQRMDSSDWALDGVDPDTIPVVLTTGAAAYDDDAFIFAVSFRYTLGGTDKGSVEP